MLSTTLNIKPFSAQVRKIQSQTPGTITDENAPRFFGVNGVSLRRNEFADLLDYWNVLPYQEQYVPSGESRVPSSVQADYPLAFRRYESLDQHERAEFTKQWTRLSARLEADLTVVKNPKNHDVYINGYTSYGVKTNAALLSLVLADFAYLSEDVSAFLTEIDDLINGQKPGQTDPDAPSQAPVSEARFTRLERFIAFGFNSILSTMFGIQEDTTQRFTTCSDSVEKVGESTTALLGGVESLKVSSAGLVSDVCKLRSICESHVEDITVFQKRVNSGLSDLIKMHVGHAKGVELFHKEVLSTLSSAADSHENLASQLERCFLGLASDLDGLSDDVVGEIMSAQKRLTTQLLSGFTSMSSAVVNIDTLFSSQFSKLSETVLNNVASSDVIAKDWFQSWLKSIGDMTGSLVTVADNIMYLNKDVIQSIVDADKIREAMMQLVIANSDFRQFLESAMVVMETNVKALGVVSSAISENIVVHKTVKPVELAPLITSGASALTALVATANALKPQNRRIV
jgi:hypothetical protein